jgi:putative ABC transport system permease protein
LDDQYNENYQAEDQFGNLLMVFCIIAILIACLGLYGLASFTAEQKIKEIGIRKVMGASSGNIVQMLSREFLILVLIAVIISTPIGIVALNKWLSNFAYKIDLSWQYFAIASLVAVGIALTTVSYQSLKAALSNPVDSLRID